jgi:hypothetical protein
MIIEHCRGVYEFAQTQTQHQTQPQARTGSSTSHDNSNKPIIVVFFIESDVLPVVHFTTTIVLYIRPVYTMPYEVNLSTIQIPTEGIANVTHMSTWYRYTVIGLHFSVLVVSAALSDTFNTTTATMTVTVTATAADDEKEWIQFIKHLSRKSKFTTTMSGAKRTGGFTLICTDDTSQQLRQQ